MNEPLISARNTLAGALARAHIDKLSPPARAYLAERLTAQIAAADVDMERNLGGLRSTALGCAKRGERDAVFPSIDAAAKALVAVSFRAAPRDWGAASDADLAQLGRYSFTVQRQERRVAQLAGQQDRPELGWWPGFGPSDDAQQTFRALTADWEAFERIGVGTRVLPFLKDDLADWRKFRDEWKNADIDSSEIGGRLLGETIRARRVREYLKEQKIVDPVLQTPAVKDVAVDEAGERTKPGGSLDSIDKWAARSPVVNWLTDPAQKPETARNKILATAGVALGLVAILGVLLGRSTARAAQLPVAAEA